MQDEEYKYSDENFQATPYFFVKVFCYLIVYGFGFAVAAGLFVYLIELMLK